MFDTIGAWGTTLVNSVKTAASSAANSWDAAVADLKARAAEFVGLVKRLQVLRSSPGISAAEAGVIDRLLSRAQSVYRSLTVVGAGVDSVAAVVPKNLLGQVARSGALGALPLIPIAVIAGAIAAVTAWVSDAKVELERLELAERVRKDGGNPADVLGGVKLNMAIVVPVGIGVIGLVVWGLSRGR